MLFPRYFAFSSVFCFFGGKSGGFLLFPREKAKYLGILSFPLEFSLFPPYFEFSLSILLFPREKWRFFTFSEGKSKIPRYFEFSLRFSLFPPYFGGKTEGILEGKLKILRENSKY